MNIIKGVVLDPTKTWECPACTHRHQTTETRPHVPLHPCAGLGGLSAPMVLEGTQKTRHVLQERGDYINGEHGILYDPDGRAIMSVVTERADGTNDCTVFAPTATAAGDT